MKATLLGFALVLLSIPAPAFAQASAGKQAQSAPAQAAAGTEPRWSQWLGCWELVTEDVRAGARAIPRQQLVDGQPRICVTPAPEGGARFETTVAGQPAIDYTMVPDGTDRPLTETECRGTQRAEWSEDGVRIYARAALTCSDDKAPRRVSGVALIAPNGQWVDVQAVAIEGRENVRVRRYRRTGQGTTSVRAIAGSSLSLDDVKDASGKVSSLALEAALVETNAGYDLTARRLADLDEAGVSDSVIDLIVALSYPEKFVVERTSRATPSTTYINDPFSLGWAYGYPVWYDDFYYSPYSYSRVGGFGSPYYGNGGLLLVPVGGGSVEPQPSGTGRVVDGLGYTRVRARDSEPAVANTSARSRPASTGDASSGGGSTSSGSSTSTSSSGSSGASSGGGSSSGSSSGDTGRTAQPR